jgi:hypothetical protein
MRDGRTAKSSGAFVKNRSQMDKFLEDPLNEGYIV